MKRIASIAVLAGLTFAAGAALAHDDAYLDTQKAPKGGERRMAGPYHYELGLAKDAGEVKENPVVVYVTDHAGQRIPTAGAAGTATILAGKLKAAATLKPDGDNRMKGVAKDTHTDHKHFFLRRTTMNKITMTALAASLAFAAPVFADDAHHPEKAQEAKAAPARPSRPVAGPT